MNKTELLEHVRTLDLTKLQNIWEEQALASRLSNETGYSYSTVMRAVRIAAIEQKRGW